jgi:hypothetical protein
LAKLHLIFYAAFVMMESTWTLPFRIDKDLANGVAQRGAEKAPDMWAARSMEMAAVHAHNARLDSFLRSKIHSAKPARPTAQSALQDMLQE